MRCAGVVRREAMTSDESLSRAEMFGDSKSGLAMRMDDGVWMDRGVDGWQPSL